ncbi:MAG: family 1 glycosylhydrolase [Bacteroidetes bacterium]|nr:family 1 glycosylhydrolase [Bacteroidota bacterium]
MEFWGGVECTVARVRNKLHDQMQLNGHENRPEDLKLIAGLGIKTLRYPLLWEKSVENPDFFNFHDERIEKLRELKIKPIAGLIHHGSGPFITNLAEDDFPKLLADFAFKIAQKFPSIEYFNPVNEPLTTARFSGLYGIWYPHQRCDKIFARIFLNEMKGIVLAMKSIREINPQAKLIPTEDLCKVHHSPLLASQANFENNRRWLTYDILTGRLNESHPLWSYFLNNGIKESELSFFLENTCIPYICGFNYYVTSERYLDEHLYIYPQRYRGGNEHVRYADLEAVRSGKVIPTGFYGLLKEAWERYHLPLSLTEVHLGCTREEQLRWLYEAFCAARKLKSEGADFRAITAWSLLGSFDWNSLLRVQNHTYESGVFDLRPGYPRRTALADLIRSLSHGKDYHIRFFKFPAGGNATYGYYTINRIIKTKIYRNNLI